MSSRRQRENFDVRTSRIYLFVFGLSFLAFSMFLAVVVGFEIAIALVCEFIAFTIGIFFIFMSIMSGDKEAQSLAEKSSSHEITIIFLMVALGLAWLLSPDRRKK